MRGRPILANKDSDRCEALTVMTEWKKRNKREQRCPFRATYTVQSKTLCRHHAVVEAMAICVERGDVKRVPVMRQPGMRVAAVNTKEDKP